MWVYMVTFTTALPSDGLQVAHAIHCLPSQVAAEHTAAQSVILKQHQVDVAAAKAAHAAAVAAAKEHWQQQQVEMEREHQLQLEAALQQHTELVQQVCCAAVEFPLFHEQPGVTCGQAISSTSTSCGWHL